MVAFFVLVEAQFRGHKYDISRDTIILTWYVLIDDVVLINDVLMICILFVIQVSSVDDISPRLLYLAICVSFL